VGGFEEGIFLEVSIHAPVKGATAIIVATPNRFEVSIHAPVKGATAFAQFLYQSP